MSFVVSFVKTHTSCNCNNTQYKHTLLLFKSTLAQTSSWWKEHNLSTRVKILWLLHLNCVIFWFLSSSTTANWISFQHFLTINRGKYQQWIKVKVSCSSHLLNHRTRREFSFSVNISINQRQHKTSNAVKEYQRFIFCTRSCWKMWKKMCSLDFKPGFCYLRTTGYKLNWRRVPQIANSKSAV